LVKRPTNFCRDRLREWNVRAAPFCGRHKSNRTRSARSTLSCYRLPCKNPPWVERKSRTLRLTAEKTLVVGCGHCAITPFR